jgi:hypothetical protein
MADHGDVVDRYIVHLTPYEFDEITKIIDKYRSNLEKARSNYKPKNPLKDRGYKTIPTLNIVDTIYVEEKKRKRKKKVKHDDESDSN